MLHLGENAYDIYSTISAQTIKINFHNFTGHNHLSYAVFDTAIPKIIPLFFQMKIIFKN